MTLTILGQTLIHMILCFSHQVDGNVSAITTLLEDKGISWGYV